MAAGAALAFRLITPGVVDQLTTTELFGVLALLILPVVLCWTLAAERRAAMRVRQNSPRPAGPLVEVEIKPMRCPECRRPLAARADPFTSADSPASPRTRTRCSPAGSAPAGSAP
jgi:hypothetical protein